ncbi:MAG: hypothetical protein WAV32_10505 [Halobacteriota archaeon]
MIIKESFEKAMTDKRTLVVIVIVAILWRTFISLNKVITLRESLCSGIVLIIFGWVLFAYLYHLFTHLKGWVISNWICQGIAVSMISINIYVLIYYGMRWLRLLYEEAYQPWDFLFRDIRYIALVVFYCGILWSAKYVKKVNEDYISLAKEKALLHIISTYLYPKVRKLREMSMRELLWTVLTDERILLIMVGLSFLWRLVISIDLTITLKESVFSGMILFMVGWLFFAYVWSMSWKQKEWLDLMRVNHGIAIGVFAINIYVLVYYGMRWYRMSMGAEVFVPLDFLFRDARFFALVIFYCASIVLSKFIKRAYEEYTLLSASAEAKEQREQ